MIQKKLAKLIAQISTVPAYNTAEYEVWINQESSLSLIKNNKENEDVILYLSAPHHFIHTALIPIVPMTPPNVDDLMQWEGNPYDCWGITEHYPKEDNQPPKVEFSSPLDDNSSKILSRGEQMVFMRSFDGRLENRKYCEISQKLVHAHGIHFVPEKNAFCRFDDNGEIEEMINCHLTEAVTIVTIKRELLNLHLAITNALLIQMFDSTRYHPDNFSGWESRQESFFSDTEKKLFYRFCIQEKNASFIRGFQILDCNRNDILENYVNGGGQPKEYATFIAVDWKNNVTKDISCAPEHIASYFEESDLPFETTPAFFKPEVLAKYKSNPERYLLKDRSITCKNAWYLETYDINDEGQVHTYLIYLSRLPYSEQLYWKSYNEHPKGKISKRAFTTDFMGQFDMSYDPLSSLRGILKEIDKQSLPWWALKSQDQINTIHYVVTDSPKEWSNEILNLHQLIVEGFKHSYIKKKLEELRGKVDKDWRSLKLLEEYLIEKSITESEVKSLISPFQQLNHFRNKAAGHASDQDAIALKVQLIKEHESLLRHFRNLLTDCDQSMRKLFQIMQGMSHQV